MEHFDALGTHLKEFFCGVNIRWTKNFLLFGDFEIGKRQFHVKIDKIAISEEFPCAETV